MNANTKIQKTTVSPMNPVKCDFFSNGIHKTNRLLKNATSVWFHLPNNNLSLKIRTITWFEAPLISQLISKLHMLFAALIFMHNITKHQKYTLLPFCGLKKKFNCCSRHEHI